MQKQPQQIKEVQWVPVRPVSVHTDLQTSRYIAIGLDNESNLYNFNIQRTLKDYSQGELQRSGRR